MTNRERDLFNAGYRIGYGNGRFDERSGELFDPRPGMSFDHWAALDPDPEQLTLPLVRGTWWQRAIAWLERGLTTADWHAQTTQEARTRSNP